MCHQHSCWRRAVAGSVCLAALTDRQAKLRPADAALPGGARDVGSGNRWRPGPGCCPGLVVSPHRPVGSGGWPWNSLASRICW
jgi:hypothetical protein